MDYFLRFLDLLRPRTIVGGVTVSDSVIRFVGVQKKTVREALRLPPGIIVDGKVRDRTDFVNALAQLKLRIEPKRSRSVNVILGLPPSDVFVQTFQLPTLARENIEEAAEFNLKILSPLGKEETYHDWQLIGETATQLEFLAAFVSRAIAEEFVAVLRDAGFITVGIEFPAASLLRLIREYGGETDLKMPTVVVQVDADGIDFAVMRNRMLYFNYFYSWRHTQGDLREITWNEIETSFVQEMRKVLNFYNSHWGNVDHVLLISADLSEKFSSALSNALALHVQPLRLKIAEPVAPVWFAALGAALKERLSKKDRQISLESTAMKNRYFYEELFTLVDFWRNVFAAVFAILLITAIVALGVINRVTATLRSEIAEGNITNANVGELLRLQQDAQQFNQLVQRASAARQGSVAWAPFLQKIVQLAGPRISIGRMSFSSSIAMPVSIAGSSINEDAISEFQRRVSAERGFADVNVPLTSIQPTINNRVAFLMSFRLTEFPK